MSKNLKDIHFNDVYTKEEVDQLISDGGGSSGDSGGYTNEEIDTKLKNFNFRVFQDGDRVYIDDKIVYNNKFYINTYQDYQVWNSTEGDKGFVADNWAPWEPFGFENILYGFKLEIDTESEGEWAQGSIENFCDGYFYVKFGRKLDTYGEVEESSDINDHIFVLAPVDNSDTLTVCYLDIENSNWMVRSGANSFTISTDDLPIKELNFNLKGTIKAIKLPNGVVEKRGLTFIPTLDSFSSNSGGSGTVGITAVELGTIIVQSGTASNIQLPNGKTYTSYVAFQLITDSESRAFLSYGTNPEDNTVVSIYNTSREDIEVTLTGILSVESTIDDSMSKIPINGTYMQIVDETVEPTELPGMSETAWELIDTSPLSAIVSTGVLTSPEMNNPNCDMSDGTYTKFADGSFTGKFIINFYDNYQEIPGSTTTKLILPGNVDGTNLSSSIAFDGIALSTYPDITSMSLWRTDTNSALSSHNSNVFGIGRRYGTYWYLYLTNHGTSTVNAYALRMVCQGFWTNTVPSIDNPQGVKFKKIWKRVA